MRIGIDCSAAVNQRAGIGRLVRNQVRALAETDHANHYVLLYARPNDHQIPELPHAPNVSHRKLPLTERWLTIAWHRARLPIPADRLCGGVDVYHSPDFVLPTLQRARGILTVHDLAFIIQPECADPKLRAYLEDVVPRSAERADFIIADSENTRNDVVVLLGAPPDRVAVVPGGVEPRFAQVTDASLLRRAREHLGVGDDPFILAVGLIEPRKNLNRLMDAFAELKRSGFIPQHKLVLAGGRGWLVQGILDHHQSSPVRDDVLFPGFVSDDLLPAVYSAADVFAFPSVYEGFGLPVLEAMGCGTPVVASRASCIPEVAEGAALLVDPTDVSGLAGALLRAITDPSVREDLQRRGCERAAHYTWERAASELLDVYREVARL